MRIDVWSDVACPWCWLGKHHLEEAVRRTGLHVSVEMHAFELDPGAGPTMPAREYLVQLFGSAERVDDAQARLRTLGARIGITYDFEHAVIANTFDAHRVHQYSKRVGLAAEVFDRYMRAYHAEGEGLANHPTLVRLAEEAGLDGDVVRDLLASDAYTKNVRLDQARGRGFGVTGVPYFVFNEREAMSGAQRVDVFERALMRFAQDD